MSKSLSKEQIEAVFAKFDSNKVFKLLHIDIAHNRDIETQFHEGWETEQGGVQELDGKQKIISSGIFARYPEQLVRIFDIFFSKPYQTFTIVTKLQTNKSIESNLVGTLPKS